MPNYQLVATSMFEPYSYERYLAPFGAYSEAYKELEDALADLLVKANIWEGMANELTDPRTYAQYKKYADDLQTLIDTIASQGLTPTSRRDMLALKKRYSSEITPIELGYAQRSELQKSQRDMLAKDPSLIFERDLLNDPQAASLDNFVGNSAYDYGRTYSGSKLMSDVSKAAENLSKTLNSKTKSGEELRAELKRVLPYQYRLLELKGFDVNDILNAIGNEPNASGILTGLIENVIDASGMRLWASEDKLNQARAYAAQGLWSAIGETSDKWLTDTYSMQGALKGSSNNGEPPVTPQLPLYPPVSGNIKQEGNLKRQETAFNTLFTENSVTGDRTFDKKYLGPNENINPLRIYDYYEQWVDTHPEYRPQAPRNIINVRDAASAERLRQMMQDLVDKRDAQFQKETGINPKNIISKEQYDALLEAGFNQNTPVEAFINSSYDDILEGSITIHRPFSLNLANYDGPKVTGILNKLRLKEHLNNESVVRDFYTGKPVKPKKMGLTENSKITDILYSNDYPDCIIIQIENGKYLQRYLIKMSFIEPGTTNWILEQLGKEVQTTDDYGIQSEIQNVGTHTVRSWTEDFNKVPSTSTSKTE